jgi:predicted AlkP superfamily phosphohydrolase/phosphomutase
MTKQSRGRTRVAVIGIDGLDANLLLKFQDDLPNFAKLIQTSPLVSMSSVFPPDSPTAWASIFTGLNPAKHGIISFKDPLSQTKVADYIDYSRDAIAGRTFWDFAGKSKKKCCIIFPHSGYPPWPVNGIMVSRTTEVDIKKFGIKTYPTNLSLGCKQVELKPVTSFPVDPSQIIGPTKEVILSEVGLGARFFMDFDWDVFFIYFSSLDNIQHIFWRYFDESDPSYLRSNRYKNIIPEFYKFYDYHVIGKFLRIVGSKDVLVVLSDHGHGMRPYNVVNINEFLSRAGFLETKIKSNSLSDVHYLQDLAKRKFTAFIDRKRVVAKIASKILSLFPQSLSVYTSWSPIEWDQTTAYLSDSSAGLKTYSYAGVRVKESITSSSYERIRQAVIDLLTRIEDPKSSEKIVEWAIRREELYDGPSIIKYPDIVFKLKDTWGVNWNTDCPLFGTSITHKIFSGTHKQDSAVLLLYHLDALRCSVDKPKLTDVTPTILDLVGLNNLNSYGSFDGRSIISSV